ncbi:colipase isoform X2 [Colius striatus]|uniref:colipase isoform X2 n=1 Tax=Colius striatus TaxID=57412 RepID=UPI002B1E20C9|nr:colipase isoform X2 [Colius striatus]
MAKLLLPCLLLVLLLLAPALPAPQGRGLIVNLSIYNVYYKCPCESGLTCDADRTIVGSITNTDYGICIDPGSSDKRR